MNAHCQLSSHPWISDRTPTRDHLVWSLLPRAGNSWSKSEHHKQASRKLHFVFVTWLWKIHCINISAFIITGPFKQRKEDSDWLSGGKESTAHFKHNQTKPNMLSLKCGILKKKKKDTKELIYKLNRPTYIENKYTYQMGKVVQGGDKLGAWDLSIY